MTPFEPSIENEAPLFSIVCATNDRPLMQRMLLPSLNRQTVPWEFRAIDAREECFTSAAQTLNAGATDARGRYLVFVHQDVELCNDNCLAQLAQHIESADQPVGVAGPVGVMLRPDANGRRRVNTFFTGEDRHLVNRPALEVPVEVQTLDELMLVVPRVAFASVQFDPQTCPGWHLYGIDLCLSMAATGLAVLAVPERVYHLSGGKLDSTYYRDLRLLLDKHRQRVGLIATPSETWPTRLPASLQKSWHQIRTAVRLARYKVTGVEPIR